MEEKIRLDKFLSDYTELTRSQAKKAIREGRVQVGETIAVKGDTKVATSEAVWLDGQEIQGERYQYIMLHKPAGVVSATVDKTNTTVVELVYNAAGDAYLAKDLFPVGRLDKDTEGLILLSNDGMLAHRILSPGRHVPKKYKVILDEDADETAVEKMELGLDIGEKHLTKPAVLERIAQREYFLTITEGKFHQVKRMFAALGRRVVYLKRVEMAGLTLDEKLAKGEWRFLTEEEIATLKQIGSGIEG